MMQRRQTVQVKVADCFIGSEHPVLIQSMLNAPANDIEANVRQAVELANAGCEMIRIAVPDRQAVGLIRPIKRAVNIPLVADIHFDYRLALACVSEGIDKIRINPGNIGDDGRVRSVVEACKQAGIPIRVGVNSGSVEKDILTEYGAPTPEAMVESALYHVRLIEKFDYNQIVVSIKTSDVRSMVQSYRLMAEKTPYPLHLGVTEAGTERMGIIKSAAGIGSLLIDGIGDTVRVSLTAPPVKEIAAAKDILKATGARQFGVNIVSCPTCGRTKIDLIGLAGRVEEALKQVDKPITVAVMGCAVNGPGEAKEADYGIAGGQDCGLLFKKGKIIGKYPERELLEALLHEILGDKTGE